MRLDPGADLLVRGISQSGAGSAIRSNDLNLSATPGPARHSRPARIRTAGLAMLRPRASDMIKLAVPGSLVARWMGWDRRAQKTAAPKRTTMARATLHARLRFVRLALAWRAALATRHSQEPAVAAALSRRARRTHGPCPARRRGSPTSTARAAERRRGIPAGCRRTRRWRGTAPASPYAPARRRGGGTSRRSSDRTGRGPTRPRPAPSPLAGQAGPATMGTSGGSGAGACLARAAAGRRSTGRVNGRATPAANVRTPPDRPDLHRWRRLRPEG